MNQTASKTDAPPRQPWYAGDHQDALFYLLIAVFFVELIVGGVSFFYGIIHASPETPGGPPVARFPWLGWALASVLSPVALLLIVHLSGSLIAGTLTREERAASMADSDKVPERMKSFFATVRHAPAIVILLAVLLMGAAIFFVDGALDAVKIFLSALVPHIPWLAGSLAALLAICFLAHAILVYRQRKMENEYAWRREVLSKTGMVIVDKNSVGIPQTALEAGAQKILEAGETLDAEARSLPPGQSKDGDNDKPDPEKNDA